MSVTLDEIAARMHGREHERLVFKEARSSGTAGAPFSELAQVLPERSPKSVQYLMRELKKEGKGVPIGRTSGSLTPWPIHCDDAVPGNPQAVHQRNALRASDLRLRGRRAAMVVIWATDRLAVRRSNAHRRAATESTWLRQ